MNHNFTTRISDERTFTVQLIQGINDMDEPIYAYAVFQTKMFKELCKKTENININEYGIPLLRGKGIPSEKTEKQALDIFKRDYLKDPDEPL